MENNMRAAWYEQNGAAREVLVVGDMPGPQVAAGEVLVQVKASGVNPSDVKTRQGRSGMAFPRIIPHSDGAGVIVDVGSKVAKARIGQRVWLFNGQWKRPFGTAAEYIALPASHAVPMPADTSFAVGACLGIPAATAHRCVFADGPVAGQTILVTGGAGAVGHYAIQFAKRGGARVITTVSGEAKAAHAKAAGADHVINYRTQDVVAAVKEVTQGQGVDRIVEVEFGANLNTSLDVIKPNGFIVTYGSASEQQPVLPFYRMLFNAVSVRLVLLYILPDEARIQAINDITMALVDGGLTHAVAKTFPLEEIAAAHEMVEAASQIGNVVLSIP